MADQQSIVALNIGSQRVSMAVFEPGKSGGLTLKSYETTSILADPATEAMRMPQLRAHVIELAQKLKVAKHKVRYAVSGQSVFIRFVKLPPIESDNIEQMVTFEAQQQLPFPIETVVWDYQLMEGTSLEKEVALVAIKADSLDEINSCVISSGMATESVDAAPMALYNAFRHAYGETTEPVLLIDVGAKTSNLLYIEGDRFFTRGIPIGGASITTAIAKEYHISFAEAEAQKVGNGLVTLNGAHAEQLDESIAALGNIIRTALTRLPSEIARTTTHYRSQHSGGAPRHVYLAGSGANLPYAREFFAEKLGLPVDYFNPLAKVSLGKNVSPEAISAEAHTMGELVGLATRAVAKAKISIDLVPASVVADRASQRRQPILIAAAAVLILGFGAFAALKNSAASAAEKELDHLSKQKQQLEATAQPIEQLLSHENALQKVSLQYVSAEQDQVQWLGILNALRSHFASEFVWVTDLEPLANYDVLLPNDPKSKNGDSVVNGSFTGSTSYGVSMLAAIKSASPAVQKGKTPAPKAAAKPVADESAVPLINAIRVRGLWRENPDSHNAVNKLIKSLRESKSPYFSFSVKAPADKNSKNTNANAMVDLKDEQITKLLQVRVDDDGNYAWPFELIIPLARPIPSR